MFLTTATDRDINERVDIFEYELFRSIVMSIIFNNYFYRWFDMF